MHKISLTGWDVVIAGGDTRETVLAGALSRAGANVWLHGFTENTEAQNLSVRQGLPERADAVILPLAGVNQEGNIYAPYAAEQVHIRALEPLFRPGLCLLCGRMPEDLEKQLRAQAMDVILTAEMDELATYNAVPTAEGAVEIAMRESDITLFGSNALVLGFGRCGLPLARLLAAMDAKVTVAARRRDVLALAAVMNFATMTFDQLPAVVGKADFIFNTAPALVLTEDVLRHVKKSAIIIDIASSPGGTDFYTAERLGIKSILALGLPGKVAPLSAGKILANVYPGLLVEAKGKGGKQQ